MVFFRTRSTLNLRDKINIETACVIEIEFVYVFTMRFSQHFPLNFLSNFGAFRASFRKSSAPKSFLSPKSRMLGMKIHSFSIRTLTSTEQNRSFCSVVWKKVKNKKTIKLLLLHNCAECS